MSLYLIAGIIIVLTVAFAVFKEVLGGSFKSESGGEREKPVYHYTRKQFFLTHAEHECYDALVAAVGDTRYIFAQVHLSTILDPRAKGRDWRAARAHIDRKSVDFVLCDKAYISPKLAIELDDKSHERPDRQERDKEVERILAEAGVPLLRLENKGRFEVAELRQQLSKVVPLS